jgi:hypothetical protein
MARLIVLALALSSVSAAVSSQPQNAAFDVILRGGTIYDGSGGRSYTADVGVVSGRIAAVGGLSGRRAGSISMSGGYMSRRASSTSTATRSRTASRAPTTC